MTCFHFAYSLFETLHFAHLNFKPLPIHYPPLLKSRIKMYFIFNFMTLSSKNKKIKQKKLKQTRSKGGGFVEKQDMYQNKIKWIGQHIWFIVSLSHSHLSFDLWFLSLSHSSLLPTTHFKFLYPNGPHHSTSIKHSKQTGHRIRSNKYS